MECPALFSDGYFSMEKRDLEVQNYYYDAPTSISREALQSRATTSENFDMQVIFLLVQRSTLYSILYNRNFYCGYKIHSSSKDNKKNDAW